MPNLLDWFFQSLAQSFSARPREITTKPPQTLERRLYRIEGKITSYGYEKPGAADYDVNSANGIGAWDNKLKPGDCAVSPDIELAFRSAGVRPMAPVILCLGNGLTLPTRWADRTSKRLTGRLDLYSPKGLHRYDGVKVTGFYLG